MDVIDENPDRINEHVSRTVLVVEILHPSDMDPTDMSQAEISGYTDMGQLVTKTSVRSSEDLADTQVDEALVEIGGQAGHFARVDAVRERRADLQGASAEEGLSVIGA